MKGTESIVVEYLLNEPPAEVWRALTDASLLARWLMPNDMQAVVGHQFTFREKPQEHWDGIVYCEILEVDQPHRLVYSWQGGNGRDKPDFPHLDTIVTWTLEATAEGGTRLHLMHEGFQPTDFALKVIGDGWRSLLTAERMSAVLEVPV